MKWTQTCQANPRDNTLKCSSSKDVVMLVCQSFDLLTYWDVNYITASIFFFFPFFDVETSGTKSKMLQQTIETQPCIIISNQQGTKLSDWITTWQQWQKEVSKQIQKKNDHRHRTESEESRIRLHNSLRRQTVKQDDILVQRKSISPENDGTDGYDQWEILSLSLSLPFCMLCVMPSLSLDHPQVM